MMPTYFHTREGSCMYAGVLSQHFINEANPVVSWVPLDYTTFNVVRFDGSTT